MLAGGASVLEDAAFGLPPHVLVVLAGRHRMMVISKGQ